MNATTGKQESAVLLAATYGRVHAIEALAQRGSSVTAQDKLGRTPVLAAARNGCARPSGPSRGPAPTCRRRITSAGRR